MPSPVLNTYYFAQNLELAYFIFGNKYLSSHQKWSVRLKLFKSVNKQDTDFAYSCRE